MNPALQRILAGIGTFAAVALVLFWTLAPLAWMFISSISPGQELLSSPPHWIPEQPTFERYTSIFLSADVAFRGAVVSAPSAAFLRGMINSLVVAGATVVICLAFGLLASFAFARLRFRGGGPLLTSTIALQMLPPIATVVPLFAIFQRVGLTDTLTALILTNSGIAITYIIWVLTAYVRTLPVELEEAGRVDGLTHFQSFLYITVPLSLPGMVAAGALCFLAAWNEFLFALVLTFTPSSKTMPVVISEFATRFGLDYGMMMTGGVLASIPPLLLALFFQRYLMSGLSAGAVKG